MKLEDWFEKTVEKTVSGEVDVEEKAYMDLELLLDNCEDTLTVTELHHRLVFFAQTKMSLLRHWQAKGQLFNRVTELAEMQRQIDRFRARYNQAREKEADSF